MKLSPAQHELLQRLGVDPTVGLNSTDAAARREEFGYNTIDPPIKCPAWICCLLPCIRHIPSIKAFQRIKPDDAEVFREGRWIRYDATSLAQGDIIRIEEGDIVPADCTVLWLEDGTEELLVDHRLITGEEKPRSAKRVSAPAETTQPTQLFWGGQVVQGSGVAVTTSVGAKTLVAGLIHDGRFPPKGNVLGSMEVDDIDDPEVEVGISLLPKGEV